MKAKGSLAWRFYFIMFGYYFAQTIFFGYFTKLMTGFGYSMAFIGAMFSLNAGATIVIRTLIGYYVDKRSNPKIIVLGLFSIYALLQVLLFRFHQSVLIVVLFATLGISGATMTTSTAEAWALKAKQDYDERLDYGKIRGMGSLAYGIGGLIAGSILTIWGNNGMIAFALLSWGFVMIGGFGIPNPIPRDQTSEKDKVTFKGALRECLSDKVVVVAILGLTLAMITNNIISTYYTLLVETLGGSSRMSGLGLFVMSFFEFLVVYSFSKISARISSKRLMYIGMFGMALKNIVLSFAPNAICAVVFTVVQVLAFSLVIPGTVTIISERVQYKYKATALQIMYTCTGLGGLFTNWIAGKIADVLGLQQTIRVAAIPAVIAGIVCMIFIEKTYFPRKAEN
ncbi:MAG: MFS transporter [Oscillospiraceae bacterium]|nr:MFS transporter [Oscillospiraceae bacterium]